MFATVEATVRYADRFPALRDAAFYSSVMGLTVSSLGIGTYLEGSAYTEALITAVQNGINVFDTAINYQSQESERCIGAALKQLQRDEIVVCTKAGFLTKGAVPSTLHPADVAGGMHSMEPAFLSDQIDRSLANMDIDTIDVFYLHNPETQLGFVNAATFDERLRRAFERLEQLVEKGKIRRYGAATWDGYRKKGALDLSRIAMIAEEVGGPEHHFRFIQLPFNLEMVEAYVDKPESVLQAAARLGITVIASATLMQTRVIGEMADSVAARLPGLATNAQRAIQFTRSTPGIACALVGMSQSVHVLENLGVARVPPLTRDEYQRFYQ